MLGLCDKMLSDINDDHLEIMDLINYSDHELYN